MALEEDIDSMKVKASQDAATIHEMRVALEQEKEGKAFLWFRCHILSVVFFLYSKVDT